MVEINVSWQTYCEAVESILRFYMMTGGKVPEYICVPYKSPTECTNKFYQRDWEQSMRNVDNYIKQHNGELPPKVWFRNIQIPITPPTPITGWTLTGLFKQDYQDTSYTCGPSSAQMVFSALGYNFNESQIASLAGTTTAGTSHQQLYNAMRKLAPNLDIAEYYLSDIGFNGIITKLNNGCEVILHIQTYPALSKDADGNSVWLKNYGHYIFLVGVNLTTQRVRVADPTKGVKEFTYTQITNAINAVSNQKSVMVFK